jgi:glutamate N-acetyltransferase/amino-acid N-acetyltransferase
MKQGCPTTFNKEEVKSALRNSDEVLIRLCLHLGEGQATVWGCDLSEEYVRINSRYTT